MSFYILRDLIIMHGSSYHIRDLNNYKFTETDTSESLSVTQTTFLLLYHVTI